MAHYFKAYKYAHGTWLSRSLYDIDRLSNELLLFLNTTQLWSFAPCYSRLIAPWGTALYPGVVCDRDSTILQCTSCYLARFFLSAATCRWHKNMLQVLLLSVAFSYRFLCVITSWLQCTSAGQATEGLHMWMWFPNDARSACLFPGTAAALYYLWLWAVSLTACWCFRRPIAHVHVLCVCLFVHLWSWFSGVVPPVPWQCRASWCLLNHLPYPSSCFSFAATVALCL